MYINTVSNNSNAIAFNSFNNSGTITSNIFDNSDTIVFDIFDNSDTITSDVLDNSDTIILDSFNNSNIIAPNISADNFDNIVSNDLNTSISDSDSISYNENEYDVNNGSEVIMYDLDEVHEIIANKFEESEIFNEPIKFILKVKLDQDLLAELLLDQENLINITNLKTIEIRFGQLASILIILLESGSGYY
ncbi:4979_t:CDS:2 [Cetraspora pellucida]|uniref:4979_t:CDS:1 n=1 Tax=Cetraspora pellucida TaxID=1433469 RepID=A0A9N9BEW6_9GLOM|nr:4979_t:CDS:2 [Cetraspora pellucida]